MPVNRGEIDVSPLEVGFICVRRSLNDRPNNGGDEENISVSV